MSQHFVSCFCFLFCLICFQGRFLGWERKVKCGLLGLLSSHGWEKKRTEAKSSCFLQPVLSFRQVLYFRRPIGAETVIHDNTVIEWRPFLCLFCAVQLELTYSNPHTSFRESALRSGFYQLQSPTEFPWPSGDWNPFLQSPSLLHYPLHHTVNSHIRLVQLVITTTLYYLPISNQGQIKAKHIFSSSPDCIHPCTDNITSVSYTHLTLPTKA